MLFEPSVDSSTAFNQDQPQDYSNQHYSFPSSKTDLLQFSVLECSNLGELDIRAVGLLLQTPGVEIVLLGFEVFAVVPLPAKADGPQLVHASRVGCQSPRSQTECLLAVCNLHLLCISEMSATSVLPSRFTL